MTLDVLDRNAPPDPSATAARVVAALAPALDIDPELPAPPPDSADPIAALLRSRGVRFRPVTLPAHWATSATGPMIGFAAAGHPVALVPHARRYRVFDPTTGRACRPTALRTGLTARAYQLYRPLPAGDLTLPALLRFALKGAAAELRLLLLGGLVAGVLGLVVPLSIATLVPFLLAREDNPLPWAAALLGGATVTAWLALLLRNAAALRLAGRIHAAIEPAVWDRLLAHDVRFFQGYSTGDLVHRGNAITTARDAISDVLVGALLGAAFSLAALTALFLVDARLGAVLLAGALAAAVVLALLARRRQPAEAEVYELHGRIHGLLYGLLLGIDKIQTAGRELPAYLRWVVPFVRQKRADDSAMRVDAAANALVAGLLSMLLSVLLVSVVAGGWTVGAAELMAAGVAAGQIALALAQVTQASATAYGALPVLRGLAPILTAARETVGGGADPGTLSGAVALDEVTFSYPGASVPALDRVSLQVAPGEFTAVVGPSGAGKSTLLRLLLGFDPPGSGHVRYDGRPLSTLDVRAVRQQIGTVLQHGRLLRGTVRDMILGASEGLTDDDAWTAAELAGIAEDLWRLPMRLDTRLGEDARGVSGGQRQRLLLARALVRRPRMLLLDEATSALDNATQADVAERIAALSCTRIVIAHRLSTVRAADRIHLLDGGRLVASGTYTHLLLTDPLFATLVRHQEP